MVDPRYRIRKLLLAGHERLDDAGHQRMLLGLRLGDPADEVLGAWLAKESVRDVYLAEDPAEAATLLDKAVVGCAQDVVPEIVSLGATLAPVAQRDPRPPRHRCFQRADRGPEPVREEGEALQPRVPAVQALPAAGAAPRRRYHLAEPTPAARIRTRAPHSDA